MYILRYINNMKFNQNLKAEIENFKDYIIVVEGKKDLNALKSLGFQSVYAIHITGVSLRERAEQIANQISKRDKICILTDLDKRGKQLYLLLKSLFQELGVHLDSTLRGILIKSRISHIEGVNKFLDKLESV